MNRGYIYLAATLVFGSLAYLTPLVFSIFFIWVAIASFYYSLAYFIGYGEILLKSKSGRIPWFMKILLLPVFIGVTLYNLTARKLDATPPIHKIQEGLWISRRLVFTDLDQFEKIGINAVLDVTAEFDAFEPDFLPKNINYYNIPVMDHHSPRKSQLNKAIQWIDKQRNEGRKVLIHCAMGQGRSATVLMAYLIHIDRDKDLTDVLKKVQDIRSTVHLNTRQMTSLSRYISDLPPEPEKTTYVIYNPAAGNTSLENLKAIKENLIPFVKTRILETSEELDAGELTKKALESNPRMIVAAGGDGTVMQVAGEMIGNDVPMGIIPLGTANALAVCLYGVPVRLDPVQVACNHILEGKIKKIDTAKCNGRPMLLLAGIGMESGMTEKAAGELKDKWGILSYLIGGWKHLDEQDIFEIDLTIDDKNYQYKTGSVTVANTAPQTSILAKSNGKQTLDDGMLDITIIQNVYSKKEAVKTMFELLIGNYTNQIQNDNKIVHHRGKQVRITTKKEQKIVMDGEIIGNTPLNIEINPQSLNVAVGEVIG